MNLSLGMRSPSLSSALIYMINSCFFLETHPWGCLFQEADYTPAPSSRSPPMLPSPQRDTGQGLFIFITLVSGVMPVLMVLYQWTSKWMIPSLCFASANPGASLLMTFFLLCRHLSHAGSKDQWPHVVSHRPSSLWSAPLHTKKGLVFTCGRQFP